VEGKLWEKKIVREKVVRSFCETGKSFVNQGGTREVIN